MFTKSIGEISFISVSLLTLLCLLPSEIVAQALGSSRGLPGTGGIHTIQGKVYGPSGRPLDLRLRVTLENPSQPSMSTVTDADGVFIFRSLEAGEYKLTVIGGKDFENATEYASIYREASPGGRVVTLAVHLKLKESSDPRFSSVPAETLNLYKKGVAFGQSGDRKKAIDHLSKAISLDKTFVPALNELGVQYLLEGQLDKAAETLQTVLVLAPDDFQPRLNFGIVLLNQKKFKEAEEHLRLALKQNPAVATAHLYLGLALMNQKNLEDAKKELEIAVASNSPEVAVAHKYLGGIYWGQRDYKRAAEELETYLRLVPKAPDAERTQAAVKDLRSKQ